MARHDTQLVGTAGEHFVAFRLAQLGHIVALPRMGSPLVDLLVSNQDGSKTLTIQVKTAEWAERKRGRGSKRKLHHLEFPLGKKAARVRQPRFFFAFVDLRGRDASSMPDVYIVPSNFIYDHCMEWVDDVKMVRWHPNIDQATPFKNDWARITDMLN